TPSGCGAQTRYCFLVFDHGGRHHAFRLRRGASLGHFPAALRVRIACCDAARMPSNWAANPARTTTRQWHAAYTKSGGTAELLMFDSRSGGHNLISYPDVWRAVLNAYLGQIRHSDSVVSIDRQSSQATMRKSLPWRSPARAGRACLAMGGGSATSCRALS